MRWLICMLAVGVLACPISADIFSIDAQSPGDGVVHPADLLMAGPNVHVPWASMQLDPGDDLDALSCGLDIVTGEEIIYFSVDRRSIGISSQITPYDVNGQAGLGQQAGDIYVTIDANSLVQSSPVGWNYLDVNQHEFGLAPTGFLGLPMQPYGGEQDNLDAYSMEEFDYDADGMPDYPVFFSLAAGSPTLGTLGASAADILIADPLFDPTDIMIRHDEIGLQFDDDIDALAMSMHTGLAYISLAPGSPTLTMLGASPADIFLVDIYSGSSQLWYTCGQLGLLFDDNVDALETNACVPEPASLVIVGLAAIGAMMRRRG